MHDRTSERIEYINQEGAEEKSFFDLSSSGVCCLFNRRLPQDAVVSIKINESVLKARVAYCLERKDGFRMGLQFVNVSGEQQKALNASVEKFSRGVACTCAIVDAPDSPAKGREDA